MKITIIQSDIVWEDPKQNISETTKQIMLHPGADIYVLPEMFNTGFTNNTDAMAEEIDGHTINSLQEISRTTEAAIVTSLILKKEKQNFNSCVFVKPDGKIDVYNKRHLFAFGGENEMFTAGTERVVSEYKGIRFLLQVCFDLRFPVWSRNVDDYDAIIYVANWPASRQNIHDILIKARAIENQAYVIACNRVGADGKSITYSGGSCIVDFKGDVICRAIDNVPNIISAHLDLNVQNEFKKKFPFHLNRDVFKIL